MAEGGFLPSGSWPPFAEEPACGLEFFIPPRSDRSLQLLRELIDRQEGDRA